MNKVNRKAIQLSTDATTKECPYCYSVILRKASRCPHCTTSL